MRREPLLCDRCCDLPFTAPVQTMKSLFIAIFTVVAAILASCGGLPAAMPAHAELSAEELAKLAQNPSAT